MAGELEKYNCDFCTNELRRVWGCEEPAEIPVHIINGKRLFRCPVSLLTPQSNFYITLYGHYKNGFLPVAGGVLDQTNKVYEALLFIDSWCGRTQEEKQKLAEKKAKRAGKAKGGGTGRSVRRPR